MSSANKILFRAAMIFCLTVAVANGYAQNKAKHIQRKETKPFTIGFQTGRELLFNTTPLIHSKQGKVHYGISKSLVLRKSLNTHLKVEAGLSYAGIQNSPGTESLLNKLSTPKSYKLSVPVTVQYYFLPQKCRFHPFCGAGVQGNMLHNSNSMIGNGDIDPALLNGPHSDTKYITILFTQGITFEVNTKIELTQSFHFIPDNTNRVIGIDLGIGFNIP